MPKGQRSEQPTAPKWAQRLGITTNRGALEYKAKQSGFANYEQFKAHKKALDAGQLTRTASQQQQAEALWKKQQASIQKGERQLPLRPGEAPKNDLQRYQFQYARLMERRTDLPPSWAQSPK